MRKLHAAGHEIASHGYCHDSLCRMTAQEFKADLTRSCAILEGITGEKVLGYRAPSFSVRQEALVWYYLVLEECGLRYSSSVFPGRTFLYGIPDFPDRIHYPVVSGRKSNIIEIPVPAVEIMGRQIGLYIRLFPGWMIRRRILRDNGLGKPVVLYVHPREIDVEQPRLELSFVQSVIHNWGVKSCEKKIESIIGRLPGRFGRMRDVLAQPPG